MDKISISNFHQKGSLIFLVANLLIVNYLVLGCVTLAKHAKPESLPLFDAHTHLNHDMTAEMLIKWMDQAGVRKMVLMPRYYSDDGKATDWLGARDRRR